MSDEIIGGSNDLPPPAPGTLATVAAEIADPCQWLVDLGPFFDRLNRFDATVGQTLDLSANPTAVAVRADFGRRKWIDLRDPRVAAGLAQLQAAGIHAGISDALLDYVLHTPVTSAENLALRKQFFS